MTPRSRSGGFAMKRILVTMLALSAIGLTACEDRTSSPRTTRNGSSRQPDNTGVNTRDRDNTTLTPGDQAQGSDTDRKITAEIRRAITNDSNMSVDARNIKIVTLNGAVTLRGPVDSQQEKDAIEAHAT